MNGGQGRDQQGLTDEHIGWLTDLDAVALAGSDLLLHSDTTDYLRWGDTTEQITGAVREVLAGDDLEQWWQCWVRLTSRYAFAGVGGEEVAAALLDRLTASAGWRRGDNGLLGRAAAGRESEAGESR